MKLPKNPVFVATIRYTVPSYYSSLTDEKAVLRSLLGVTCHVKSIKVVKEVKK